MALHVATLAFCTALAGFMMGISMNVLYHASPRERCLRYWSMAGVMFGMGNFIDAFALGSSYWLSPALSNTLSMLAIIFLSEGVRRYLNIKTKLALCLVIALLFFAVQFLPLQRNSAHIRIATATAIASLFLLHPAYALWRQKNDGTLNARRLLSAIFACYSCLLVIRALGFIFQPEKVGFFTSEPIQVISYIIDICFVSSVMLSCAGLVFRKQELHLQALISTDPLTGMNNRFLLADFVNREISRAQRCSLPLSVLVLDLDYFKRINDQFGHDGGDYVLKKIALCLGEILRDTDMAFRIGGEEFMIWLPGADLAVASQIAERICAKVRCCQLTFKGRTIVCTVSIGVAQWQTTEASWESTFGRADGALYQAKAQGRDRVVC